MSSTEVQSKQNATELVSYEIKNKLIRELRIIERKNNEIKKKLFNLERKEKLAQNTYNQPDKQQEEKDDLKRKADGDNNKETKRRKTELLSQVTIPGDQKNEEDKSTKLESTVVRPKNEGENRRRLLQDEDLKRRNRKMFGFLRDYLGKSKSEIQSKSEQLKKKQEIERKVTEREAKESEEQLEKMMHEIKQEKEDFVQQKEIYEKKLSIFEEALQKFYEHEKALITCNFLQTKTKPQIFYLPKKQTEQMKKIIEEQYQNAVKKKEEFELFIKDMEFTQPVNQNIDEKEARRKRFEEEEEEQDNELKKLESENKEEENEKSEKKEKEEEDKSEKKDL